MPTDYIVRLTCRIHRGHETRMLKATFIKTCLSFEQKYSECRDCEIGSKIAAGLDFDPPENVEWIDLDQPETDLLSYWLPIPADELPGINLTGLRQYWKLPLIPSQKMGICPNCLRYKFGPSGGVCDTCRKATFDDGRKLTGLDLLAGLRAKAQALNPSGTPEEPPDDEPPLERPRIVGKIDLPPEQERQSDQVVMALDENGRSVDPNSDAAVHVGRASDFADLLAEKLSEKEEETGAEEAEESLPAFRMAMAFDPTAPLESPAIKRATIFDFGDDELEFRGDDENLLLKITRQGEIIFAARLNRTEIEAVKEIIC